MNLNEVVREFLLESHENLDQLDRAFVELEKNPQDHENIAGIFRTIHTIKGTAGFIGFPNLERVTHAGEAVLSMLRDGTLSLDREITSALVHMVDVTRQMLDEIESSGAEGQETYPELIAELEAIAHGKPATPEPQPEPHAERREAERRSGDDRRLGVTETSLRVDVGLLDKLMNLVGELVLSRNQILQFTSTHTESNFVGATQRLNLVTSELQEGVMKTRMQPIGNVWSKFPRVVRDIATICNKRVRLQMFGKDTELDKTILEAIKRVSVFAGATIMGDGRVALILDVPGVAQQANVIADLRDRHHAESKPVVATSADGEELQTLLLFRVGRHGQMALPLSMVARLEEFPASSVERSSDRAVVQYRGEILPLVSLTTYFTGAPTARDPLQVIVYADGDRRVGLIVDEILDIVHEVVTISNPATRPGVLGSAIIQQRVTDLLDVQAVRAA